MTIGYEDSEPIKFDNKPVRLQSYDEWNPEKFRYVMSSYNERRAQRVQELISTTRPSDAATLGQQLTRLYQLNPNMDPALALSLAKSNASDTVAKGIITAKTYADLSPLFNKNQQQQPKQDDENFLFGAMKGVVRWGLAGLGAPWDAITGRARNLTASALAISPEFTKEFAKSRGWEFRDEGSFQDVLSVISTGAIGPNALEGTELWQMLFNTDVDEGTGFLPSEDIYKASEDIARSTLSINGKGWTMGRGIASTIADPETIGYNNISGTIDALAALFLDPTVIGAKASAVAKAMKVAGKTSEATAAAQRSMDFSSFAEAAKRARGLAEKDAKTIQAELTKDYKKLSSEYADLDSMYLAGKASTGRVDSDIEQLRVTYQVDNLAARVEELKGRIASIKAGNVNEIVNAVINPKGVEYIKAEARRTRKSYAATTQRIGLDFLRENGMIDSTAKNVARTATAVFKKQLTIAQKNLDEALRKVYGSSNPNLTPQEIIDIESSIALRTRLLAERKKTVEAWSLRERKPWEQFAFVERSRAGLNGPMADRLYNRQKALEWFSNGNADVIFEAFAKIESPALINRLTKGKYGILLSTKIAEAKTATEVENIIIKSIGGEVDSALPKNALGRIRVAADPAAQVPLSARGLSEAMNAKYQRVFGKFNTTDAKMPSAQFIHFSDVDAVALNIERWLKTARMPQEFRDGVINQVAEAAKIENWLERNTEMFKVITTALTETGLRAIERSGTTNPEIIAAIKRAAKAYQTDRTGQKTYGAFRESLGEKDSIIYIAGKEIRIADSAVGIADFADGIALPNVRQFQNVAGRAAEFLRKVDELGPLSREGKGYAELIGINVVKRITDFIFDDILRTSLLAFRAAFVIRNIAEMQIRQALSPTSVSAFEKPLLAMAMATSDPTTSVKWLNKVAAKTKSSDQYLLDINGRPYYDVTSETAQAMPQEILDSMTRLIGNRTSAFDGRYYTLGGPAYARLNFNGTNLREFNNAWVGELIRFRSDPIRRAVASGELPEKYAALVTAGQATYEQAFVRALSDGAIRGIDKATYNAFANASEKLRAVLTGNEENRVKFFFGKGIGSFADEIERVTLGIPELRAFIATGKVKDFTMTANARLNISELKKVTRKFIADPQVAERAKDGQMLYNITAESIGVGNIRKAVDLFFEVSSSVERRVVYGPEYRVAYWKHVAEMAPYMKPGVAEKILENASDIVKTKIVVKGKETPWTTHSAPRWKALQDAVKNEKGIFSFDDVQKYAHKNAVKHVSDLFYNAAETDRWAYALRLIFPFIAAWENSLRKWGKLSASVYGLGRVERAQDVLKGLESEESGTIYDTLGMQRVPGQGFIYDNQYGEKAFRIPFSGNLISMILGEPVADIETPLQSLNLVLAGGQVPGTDISALPGFGQLVQFGLRTNTDVYNALPEYIRGAVSPYGLVEGDIFTGQLPAWARKIYTALFSPDRELAASTQSIMNYKISADPRFQILMTGKLSAGERQALQQLLIEESSFEARKLTVSQGILQSVLPGTPVMNYFAETKEGSFSQVQLQKAFNKMYEDLGNDYQSAFTTFANTFGDSAIPILINGYKTGVFASSEAWNFSKENTDLADKYLNVLPYFFPRDGAISTEYARALRRRAGSERLTAKEVLEEADRLTATLVKNRLIWEAANFGYDDQWIKEQYNLIIGEKFGGWNPSGTFDTAGRENKVQLIREAIADERMLNTPMGQSIATYLNKRDTLLQRSIANGGPKTLTAIGNTDIRLELEQLSVSLIEQNPDFKWVFSSLFASELGQ